MSGNSQAGGVMQLAMSRLVGHALGVAAELRVADQLAHGPATPEDLARAVGAHGPTLGRLLRALASFGVFAEDEQGRFVNTPQSQALRSGQGAVRARVALVAHPAVLRAWENLEHAVRTGGSAFERAHGEPLFQYMQHDQGFAEVFREAMAARSAVIGEAVVDAFDFSGVRRLADVGGGVGMLLARILAKNPTMRGVLLDLPEVVERAPEVLSSAGVVDRCEVLPGNFFESVPADCDGYLLNGVLHDWDDARCHSILRNIADVARPGARVFVIEMMVPSGNRPHPSLLLDLQMLVVTSGGRERTRSEWSQLLGQAGFRLQRCVETRLPEHVLEATSS